MRADLRRSVEVDLPADVLWRYVTDWPRQGEWIPLTRVEEVDGDPRALGGRIRAWTGLGPLGFWDTMTITAWEESSAGGRCEVLHTGRVVRGVGEFAVEELGPGRSRFVWFEGLALPLGPLGGLGWRLVGPVFARGVDQALRRMARRAVRQHRAPAGG